MGENICKGSNRHGINLQNIKIAQEAQYLKKKKQLNQKIARNFPDGTVDKELTYQYREHKFDPWSGKIPHAV